MLSVTDAEIFKSHFGYDPPSCFVCYHTEAGPMFSCDMVKADPLLHPGAGCPICQAVVPEFDPSASSEASETVWFGEFDLLSDDDHTAP